MQWMTRDLAVAIHDRQLAEHGGSPGIRDEGLLLSALARPQNSAAYAEAPLLVHELAASLAFGLARNHPFIDGNKRTAYVCCRTFLRLNGADMAGTQQERFLNILALAEGRVTEAEYAQLINPDRPAVHETRGHYGP